jgi:hypothetical protein
MGAAIAQLNATAGTIATVLPRGTDRWSDSGTPLPRCYGSACHSMYSDPGALSGGTAEAQRLHEVAIDHRNRISAGTNNCIAEIGGGRPPMTVEEFVAKNREAFA